MQQQPPRSETKRTLLLAATLLALIATVVSTATVSGPVCATENTDSSFQPNTSWNQSNGLPLNSATLPFIVVPLPSTTWNFSTAGIGGATIAAVVYQDKVAYAVVGDQGPAGIIGEGTNEPSGTFDTATEDATKAFQTRVGLSSNGVVDSHTWTALLAAGDQPTLRNGSTGTAVSRLQRSLTAALSRTVGIDGQFGTITETAAKDYQRTRQLVVDGVIGPATWTALQAGR